MTLQQQLELYCIGAVLKDPVSGLRLIKRYGVTEESFTAAEAVAAWRGINKLAADPEAEDPGINLVAVVFAADWGAITRDGGMVWLGDAMSECLTVALAPYHFLSLRREEARRVFRLAAVDVLEGLKGGKDVFDLAKGMEAALRVLRGIQEMITPLDGLPSSPTHLPSQIRKDPHAS